MTVQGSFFGQELEARRTSVGITRPQMAALLDVDLSTVNRWEHGKRRIEEPYLTMYLTLCKVSPEEIELFKVRNSTVLDRVWGTLGATTDRASVSGALLRAEFRAAKMTAMASTLVPGLLQTPGYASFTFERSGADKSQIDSLVAERMGRAAIVQDRVVPLELDILLDEAVLRRPAGNVAATLAQIRHLSNCAVLPHINIQIVPLSAGWSVMQYGQFNIYEFSDDDTPVAYQELQDVMIFFNDPKDVDKYRTSVDRVRPLAMSPEQSAGFMLEEIKRLEKKV